MSGKRRLESMTREERIALCREVMENLSDLIEGEAPADFCEKVDELLSDCHAYHAFRDTLEATIDLTHECGDAASESGSALVDEDSFRRCVEKVRDRLS